MLSGYRAGMRAQPPRQGLNGLGKGLGPLDRALSRAAGASGRPVKSIWSA